MELINNRITTLKTQNSNNHAIGIWTLKANFIKNSLIHDQSIVTPFGKANWNVALFARTFTLGIDPDGVSRKNDFYNIHGITDHLIINQRSPYFQENLKFIRKIIFWKVYPGTLSQTKIPKKMDST